MSCGCDSTLRVWDVRTQSEVQKLDFSGPVNSVELSRDEKTLTVAAGTEVSFWDTNSYLCRTIATASASGTIVHNRLTIPGNQIAPSN